MGRRGRNPEACNSAKDRTFEIDLVQMHVSAYINVFDDWDILGPALAAAAPFVKEIVVVDGAYRWMCPILEALGRDPARSDSRVAEVAAPFGSKVRFLHGVWDNECSKRAAGYAACTERFIMRLDADEILFVDTPALGRFFASGSAVAEMEIPIYLAPGWVRGKRDGKKIWTNFERSALLFDRKQIDAQAHLSYLWLMVSEAEQSGLAPRNPALVSKEPVAFGAHLTHWRCASTAACRARFYVSNYLREHMQDQLRGIVASSAAPSLWMECLLGHAIVAGWPEMAGWEARPTPLSDVQESTFAHLYAAFLDNLTELNARLSQSPRSVTAGDFQYLDISSPKALAALQVQSDQLRVHVDHDFAEIKAELLTLRTGAPAIVMVSLPVAVDRNIATFRIPSDQTPGIILRRVLRIRCWDVVNSRILQLQGAPAQVREMNTEDISLALSLFEQERYLEANDILKSLLPGRGDQSFLAFCIARNCFLSGEREAARTWFKRSLASVPVFRWTHYEFSRLLDSDKDPTEARKHLILFLTDLLEDPVSADLNEFHVNEIIQVAHRGFEQDRDQTIPIYRLILTLGARDYLTELRVLEDLIDANDICGAEEAINRIKAVHTLDSWGVIALSRIQFAHGDGALAVSTVKSAIEAEPTNQLLKTIVAHKLLDFGALDDVEVYYREVLRTSLASGSDVLDLAIGGLRFRLEVLRGNHASVLQLCKMPGFLDNLPNWICVEALFRFSLSGLEITQPDLDAASEISNFLEASPPYTLGTILGLFQFYGSRRLWERASRFQDSIVDHPLSTHYEIELRRFELLCWMSRLDEAHDFYQRCYSNKSLRPAEAEAVLRFLSERKMWAEAARVLEKCIESVQGLPGPPYFLLRLARQLNLREKILQKINSRTPSELPSALKRLMIILTDDLTIGNASNARSTSLNYGSGLSFQSAILMKAERSGNVAHRKPSAGFLCVDKPYFLSALTFFASFATHSSADMDVEWFVFLANNVPQKWTSILTRFARKLGLQITVVREVEFAAQSMNLPKDYGIFTGGNTLSHAAYFRIYAARYICSRHSRFERGFYFDSDVVCNRDIAPLMCLPFDGAVLMARAEEPSPEIDAVERHHTLSLGQYFNSGVLGFDFSFNGVGALLDHAIRICEHEPTRLVFHDQCALNIAFAGKVKYLPIEYNYFLRSHRVNNGDFSSALLLHFLDQPKPWDVAYGRQEYRFVWSRYAGTVRALLPAVNYNVIVQAANS